MHIHDVCVTFTHLSLHTHSLTLHICIHPHSPSLSHLHTHTLSPSLPYCHQGCDLVVAVTHMRWPNDRRLAREVPEIQLILGGHDHDYQWEMVSYNNAALLSFKPFCVYSF